ncbi:uncharacterized protein LOC132563719 [Ylistrum balloti]|uniref:uncharacterized protein LOC132563719 n=1 Tax=Ylistrum balloti TaxID=509963 RepID=UPI0029059974|nr:uncharacterized protein LOC132563719 [Ylistrum balloti]
MTPIPKMTPVHAQRMRPSLTMQLTPVTPSPVRRRRRQHLCIDRNTQISKDQLRNNMKTGTNTCLPLVLPDPRNSTVKDLFSRPGKKALNHPSILPLWKSNTKYGISETDSDRGIPVWSVPDLHLPEEVEPRSRKRLRISTLPTEKLASPSRNVEKDITIEPITDQEVALDMPSIEMVRDPSISMETPRHGDVTPASLHRSRSLVSDVDKSKDSFTEEPSAKRRRSSIKTRSKGGTSSEDDVADVTARALSEVSIPTTEDVSLAGNLSVVQEEEIHISHIQDIRPTEAEPQPTPSRDLLIRTIGRLDGQETPTIFQHICPPLTSSRHMAAKMFSTLLDLCAENKLEVEQPHPYGDIYISKGDNW